MKRSLDRKIQKMTQSNHAEIITQMAVYQAVILNKMTNVERRVESIEKKLEKDYVTQDQLAPVKRDVAEQRKQIYFVVSLIVTAVVAAVLKLVILDK